MGLSVNSHILKMSLLFRVCSQMKLSYYTYQHPFRNKPLPNPQRAPSTWLFTAETLCGLEDHRVSIESGFQWPWFCCPVSFSGDDSVLTEQWSEAQIHSERRVTELRGFFTPRLLIFASIPGFFSFAFLERRYVLTPEDWSQCHCVF